MAGGGDYIIIQTNKKTDLRTDIKHGMAGWRGARAGGGGGGGGGGNGELLTVSSAPRRTTISSAVSTTSSTSFSTRFSRL